MPAKKDLVKGSGGRRRGIATANEVKSSLAADIQQNQTPEKSIPNDKVLFVDAAEQRTKRVSVVLTPTVYAKVQEMKKEQGARSLNDFISRVLELYCDGVLHS